MSREEQNLKLRILYQVKTTKYHKQQQQQQQQHRTQISNQKI